jgi:putative DNA methylase
MTHPVTPFSIKDAPSLIERILPVQKLSAEAYKEQMAVHGKTLTALGGYWKGRKPLILNKACILGCLLPATDNPKRDLEIFEKLMAMDDESFVARWPRRPKPREILASLSIANIDDFFISNSPELLPQSSPVDWSKPELADIKVRWRDEFLERDEWQKEHDEESVSTFLPNPSSLQVRRRFETQLLPNISYNERVDKAHRPEEVNDTVHDHIWAAVNAHLGTDSHSFPELIEQIGIMRFGHRPLVADTFCGSGQIPFEAARLGCNVFASDLNPIACLLTWANFNIVGGSTCDSTDLSHEQLKLVQKVQKELDHLNVETDGCGWRAKVFLYCVEARCPQSGWLVPLLPSRVVSKSCRTIAELKPDPTNKCYDILIRSGVSDEELKEAETGTVGRDNRYSDAYLSHQVQGTTYKTKITTLRGDFENPDGTISNKLRTWSRTDFTPAPEDIFQERLYGVQWMRKKKNQKADEYEFRSVTKADLERERIVIAYLEKHLVEWQEKGYLPDMRIEPGEPPRYQGLDLIRGRGWNYWHQAFNPRQLLLAGLLRQNITARLAPSFAQSLNSNSRLSPWSSADGGGGAVKQVFANQALNTLYNYGCRSSAYAASLLLQNYKHYPLLNAIKRTVTACPADKITHCSDIFITDPPYGDAVKYEEILDFFIAWFRKNPPQEFANWIWDSRRSLAIKGEGEDFRREMVGAYKHMTECMPENGIQVIMFTHQSGSIWADMANIVWASGLQVTAAWYVVTETESALRSGSNVKGTVLLVLRKRYGKLKTTRDDLAWDIQEEVAKQISDLTGLNQEAKGLYRDENVFEDADIQMAGYAAALRVLTRYAVIDGRDMTAEAIRPRVKGETTFVDGLIAFAVDTANQCLVPQGIPSRHWNEFSGAERFYLKLIDLEAKGLKSLDNYQNFAKAFKVRNFHAFMGSQKAGAARLLSAVEFGQTEMSDGSEFNQSVLRAVLYAVMELVGNLDGNDVLAHLKLNIADYYSNQNQRERAVEIADYLAKKLENLRPDEASAARVLRELLKNQQLG